MTTPEITQTTPSSILDFPKVKASKLTEGELFFYLEPEEAGGGVDVCVVRHGVEEGIEAFSFVDLEVVSFAAHTSVRRIGVLKGRENDHSVVEGGEAGRF